MVAARLTSRPRLRAAGIVVVAIIGALVGTAWDLLHVWTDTTRYSIGPGRLPLWVPLEFALVYVVGVSAIVVLGSPSPDASTRSRLIREAAWVTVVYAMTALLHRYELLVVALAAAALVVRGRALLGVVRANAIPAAVLVVAGPVVEAILIFAGVFSYEAASLGNVPLWLPLLYANAVPFAVRLAETATTIGANVDRVR